MVVLTQQRRPGLVGLHIGSLNVQQYFPREIQSVHLELDHLCIVCTLDASFWNDRPEIHDMRLSSWLESKRNSGKLGAQPSPVTLVPCGQASFRIQLATAENAVQVPHIPAKAPGVTYFSPTVSPSALLDRRKHDIPRMPDRRKVARIRSDERSAATAGN